MIDTFVLNFLVKFTREYTYKIQKPQRENFCL